MSKDVLIPDETTAILWQGLKMGILKMDLSPKDKPASYQLVGGVKAYLGDDG